ncbi:MAG: EVE domain-containing protein [Deltaproteobacteria bacterium]|nr:EVE domain-containing protein [Deltaproteobacteria bacterium]
MNHWLMKTEPSVFSFEDLVKAPKSTTPWEGVRNYQARNLMRDSIKMGDLVLIYHSNAEPMAVVGVAEVVKEGHPDKSAMDPKSQYFDNDAAKKGTNPWVLVGVKAKSRFTVAVTRDALKKEKGLASMMVLKKGARLSVQPVTCEEFQIILRLGKPEPI